MANQYDADYTRYTIKSLRTQDAAYLQGAVRGEAGLQPTAMARGPYNLLGPGAGNIGAGEYWLMEMIMPARPDLAWVLVMCELAVVSAAGQGVPQRLNVAPIGDNTDITVIQPPIIGPGNALTTTVVETTPLYLTTAAVPLPRTMWVPFDPELTGDGFNTLIMAQCEAGGGIVQYGWRCRLGAIRWLGYPVNAYSTGLLQQYYGSRGS